MIAARGDPPSSYACKQLLEESELFFGHSGEGNLQIIGAGDCKALLKAMAFRDRSWYSPETVVNHRGVTTPTSQIRPNNSR
jgi:hypothetical protein